MGVSFHKLALFLLAFLDIDIESLNSLPFCHLSSFLYCIVIRIQIWRTDSTLVSTDMIWGVGVCLTE